MSTGAYVDLMFAWGHARLSDEAMARNLVVLATERLRPAPGTIQADRRLESIQSWLLDAFGYRIVQATNGLPHLGPLPPELHSRLESERAATESGDLWIQYPVDFLRYVSLILEPTELVDPYRPWKRQAAPVADSAQVLMSRRPVEDYPDLTRAGVELDQTLAAPVRPAAPLARSLAVSQFITVLSQHSWSDRRSELLRLLERLPRFSNQLTTAAWYARAHLETADRAVLAVVTDGWTVPECNLTPPPDAEFASRREALSEVRARLVAWGQPDWDPAKSK